MGLDCEVNPDAATSTSSSLFVPPATSNFCAAPGLLGQVLEVPVGRTRKVTLASEIESEDLMVLSCSTKNGSQHFRVV